MRKNNFLTVFALTALLSAPAFANGDATDADEIPQVKTYGMLDDKPLKEKYFYAQVGGGVGYLDNFKVDKLTTSINHTDADRGAAWRVGAGYMFMPYLGVELDYINYLQAVTKKDDDTLGQMEFKSSAESGVALAVLRYPMSNFAVYGKVGAAYNHYTTKSKEFDTLIKGSQKYHSWDVAYAVGGEYNLIHTVAMQLEYLATSPDTSSAMINILAKF